MNVTRAATIASLAGAVLFFSAVVNAQPRGPSPLAPGHSDKVEAADSDAARAAKLADLEAWLGRLRGRFHFEGVARALLALGEGCETGCWAIKEAHGIGECFGIGDGPGVHCIINVPWPRFFRQRVSSSSGPEIPWASHNLGPATVLYGIDPDNLGIRFLLADGRSRATEAAGLLQGDTVKFLVPVVGDPTVVNRDLIFWVRVPPDSSKPIEMWYEARFRGTTFFAYRFVLRRDPLVESD